MDLSTAFLLLDDGAHTVGEGHGLLRGAYIDLVVPIDGLPRENLRAWILQADDSPLALRLRAALHLDETIAWRLLDDRPPGRPLDLASLMLLREWQARRLAAVGAPAEVESIIALPENDRALKLSAKRGFYHLLRLFPGHRRPWHGPVMISRSSELLGELAAESEMLARPVLPVLLMEDTPAKGRDLDVACASALIVLQLERLRRDGPPWPDWLRQGLLGVATARLHGQGPSPRAMHRQRRAAGAQALLDLVSGERPAEPALATALVAPLVHTRRVARFGSFLDLLRNGIDPWEAMSLAYELDIQTLLDRP